jgi:hypothetical protein
MAIVLKLKGYRPPWRKTYAKGVLSELVRAGPRKPRHADILKDFGCEASVEDLRRTLAEVKA